MPSTAKVLPPETESEDTALHADTLFLDTLRLQRRGDCLDELGAEIRRLVNLVRDRQAKGTISLTLEIRPNGRDADQISIVDVIKTKEPKVPSAGFSIFFADSEGNLLRNDPRQPNLPFGK